MRIESNLLFFQLAKIGYHISKSRNKSFYQSLDIGKNNKLL